MEGKTKKKPTKWTRPKKKAAAKIGVEEEQCAGTGNPNGSPSSPVIIDPWLRLRSPLGGKLSPAEEWKRLQDLECRGREMRLVGYAARAVLQAPSPEVFRLATSTQTYNDDQEDTCGGVIAGEVRGSLQDNDSVVERLVIRGDTLPFAATSVYARYFLVSSLTSLDVGGTRLDDTGMETIATWTPWLRELMAADNIISRMPLLDGLVKLQVLDLSHNRIGLLDPRAFTPELGLTLRRLNLASNRLDRLTTQAASEARPLDGLKGCGACNADNSASALHTLTSLVDLNLSNNNFDNFEYSLAVITRVGFPRLVSFDFRGNNLPQEQEMSELLRIGKGLPTLKTLNGETVSRTAMLLSSKKPIFELLSTGDQCAKEGRREESCSCTEGNPCAVAYHCRDWANRFEVAAAAAAARGGQKL